MSNGGVEVQTIPCLRDNYAYLLWSRAERRCVVIDPGEAAPVLAALAALPEAPEELEIWCTHHHRDHVGGVEELVATRRVARVLAHRSDRHRVPCQNVELDDGDGWHFGGCEVRVMHVPGHTLGAVAYHVIAKEKPYLFTGDTLFLGGCGRLFEGDAAMLFDSLGKLAALPAETLVYCGHEYTQTNLRFARSVDAHNPYLAAAEAQAARLRDAGQPTVPGNLGDERKVNPFLRAASVAELARLRLQRDGFR